MKLPFLNGWVRREELERALEENRRLQQAVHRMTDNALFGAGLTPVFEPEADRFQMRSSAAQLEASAPANPLSPAQWRRRLEEMEREAAERERHGELARALQRIAEERASG